MMSIHCPGPQLIQVMIWRRPNAKHGLKQPWTLYSFAVVGLNIASRHGIAEVVLLLTVEYEDQCHTRLAVRARRPGTTGR